MPQLKVDLRVKKTQKWIKESFRQLLKSKDIDAITIKEICDNCEIARRTFYAHYTDKYALLEEMIDNKFADLNQICQEMTLKNLGEKTMAWLEYFKNDQAFFTMVLTSSASYNFRVKLLHFTKQQLQLNLYWHGEHDVKLHFLAAGVTGIIENELLQNDHSTTETAQKLTEILRNNV